MRVSAKRLSAVEASADASHQHEFHAGSLRKHLGFGEGRTSGELTLIYHAADGSDPEIESSAFTLYDAREGRPRSAEYRLYFDSPSLQRRARPGDILMICRPADTSDLKALVVPRDSTLGRQLGSMLDSGAAALGERFVEVVGSTDRASAEALVAATADPSAIPDPEDFLAVADAGFVESAIAAGRLPPTRRMAEQAGSICARLRRDRSDADLDLQWGLDAETALFQQIERGIGQRWLDDRAASGQLQIDDAMDFALRRLQARKSRRGQSLQNHFARVLDDRRIQYGAQCTTERGEKPDFLFPGCKQYHDPSFPKERLRMVACKSLLRERWDQPINEADKIDEKYILTVDPDLTDDRVKQILASRLVLFLPRPVLDGAYQERASRLALRDVTDLIHRLEAAAAGT